MAQNHSLIHHFLENSAREYPAKIALIHDGVRATYSEVNTKANTLAHYLLQRGVQRGDRVGILFENCLEYVVSYYGVLKAGAVAVPLSTDLKADSLNSILLELEPRSLIASSRFENLLKSFELNQCGLQELILKTPNSSWNGTGLKVTKLDELLHNDASPNPRLENGRDSLASIIYTSGSTGRPKGVMLSHGNIVSNTDSICQYLNLTASDIQMVVLPFFYVMGKSLLNTHFAVGGTVVINNKFAFPASVLGEMVKEKVTGFSGVPSTYAYLLHRSPLASYRDKLESLRYCTQAGGHMSRTIKEGLRQVLPAHTQIFIMYGATEASARLSFLQPERYTDKMESIGKAIPKVTLRLLDSRGQEVAPGEIGELTASGPNIMQGYWKDPESSAKVLDENGYHTGDQAYCDQEGFFYIVGRKDDLLKVGGHRINVREIEDVLMESGLLLEAVVLGVLDTLLGRKLVACAVPKSNECTEREMLAYCVNKLAKYKIPNQVVMTRSLPKNASGKIDRTRCLDLWRTNSPTNTG